MERKKIYLCLAHMSEEGMEQNAIAEKIENNMLHHRD